MADDVIGTPPLTKVHIIYIVTALLLGGGGTGLATNLFKQDMSNYPTKHEMHSLVGNSVTKDEVLEILDSRDQLLHSVMQLSADNLKEVKQDIKEIRTVQTEYMVQQAEIKADIRVLVERAQ